MFRGEKCSDDWNRSRSIQIDHIQHRWPMFNAADFRVLALLLFSPHHARQFLVGETLFNRFVALDFGSFSALDAHETVSRDAFPPFAVPWSVSSHSVLLHRFPKNFSPCSSPRRTVWPSTPSSSRVSVARWRMDGCGRLLRGRCATENIALSLGSTHM